MAMTVVPSGIGLQKYPGYDFCPLLQPSKLLNYPPYKLIPVNLAFTVYASLRFLYLQQCLIHYAQLAMLLCILQETS